jgi:hypothetical protein
MEKKEKLTAELRSANISLILTSYGDIFSDFDARPSFLEKAISDDFLWECERAAKDKKEGFELVLFVPKANRNLESEFQIKKRLKEHFHKHVLEKEKEISTIRQRGYKWIFTGVILVIIAILIRAFKSSALADSIIEPLLVIPGWFTIWEGLTKALVKVEDHFPNFEFYRKMNRCQIIFRSY